MEKVILHIDVNNAFLSWTAVDLLNNGYKYDIRNSYSIIGGDETKRRGIVLAKSTPAKKLGIVTAETLYTARKKCPNLNVYPPNYYFYSKMSKELFNLLSKYTPDIEVFSIDECFIDYTSIKRLYGDEVLFAHKLKVEFKKELGFTVNIGIGNNKLCAKMASDFIKPDKVHTLYLNEIKDKLWVLPIRDLFGVGKQTSLKLTELGINSIGDLANTNIDLLYKHFKNQAVRLQEMANGIDDSMIITKYNEPKGIGNEITLDHDVNNKEEVYKYLFILAEQVGIRIRKQNKYAGVIAVILKDRYFKRKSHQKKLVNKTNITEEIYKYSKEIYDEFKNEEAIRLIGIRLDDLSTNKVYQVSLFDDITKTEKLETVDKVLDVINSKFGAKTIEKASLYNKK